MFWFNGLIFFLMACLFAGCGWKPLYGQGEDRREIAAQLAGIEIQASENNVSQIFQEQLIAAFGYPNPGAEKKLHLIVSVKIKERSLLIRSDDRAARRNLSATASYWFKRKKDNSTETEDLFSDKASAIVSYNRVSAEFANLIARRTAQKRVLDQLALTIKQRIIAFLRARDKDNGQNQAL